MKINQHCRQSKSPFQAFLGTSYYSGTKLFFVDQPWRLTFCQGIFARGHQISNLNPEIGRGHQIIIAFREDSIKQKHR